MNPYGAMIVPELKAFFQALGSAAGPHLFRLHGAGEHMLQAADLRIEEAEHSLAMVLPISVPSRNTVTGKSAGNCPGSFGAAL